MEASDRAATSGGEYVRTESYEGVIFPEGHGRVWDEALFPYWTPTRDVVLAAESRLAAFLQNFPPNQGEPRADWLQRYAAPLILARLSQYRRQYSGIVLDGQPALHINFFMWDGHGDWVTQTVEVDDGGHDYFQVVYRPAEGDFVRFWVNGVA
jgi:hypothetical protein